MQHMTFPKGDTSSSPDIALLIKSSAFLRTGLEMHYVDKLTHLGLKPQRVAAFDVVYSPKNTCPVKLQRAYLNDLLPCLKDEGIKYLLVADPHYFKTLTKERKTEPHFGYVLPCAIEGYTDMHVVLLPNYHAFIYSPGLEEKRDLSLKALVDHIQGRYQQLGSTIIHSHEYLIESPAIYTKLQELKQFSELTIDIETLSLHFWETGVVTIAFAWDQHNGVTFWCDAYDKPNPVIRQYLLDFFLTYQGTLIYQNANFDMKILINTLFMDDLLDEEGKQQGIEVMTRKFHDTKLITYLATNSCTGNALSLKEQAHEFAGNYAQENISDIRQIDPEALMEYNLVDALSTWYVFNKHFTTMVADQQAGIYEDIFKPSVGVILQMELTGLPVCMKQVKKAKKVLSQEIEQYQRQIQGNKLVQDFTYLLREQEMIKVNSKLKVKQHPLSHFDKVEFNPNSAPQLQKFFYDFLNFPVIDKTDTGAPATGADTLKKLKFRTTNPDHHMLIDAMIGYAEAIKIRNTFISAFERAVHKSDGWHYVHGNFNLGGTVSGRLSSTGPNLQNLPSTGTKWAKLVKSCVVAPPGWFFVGADFASLEDRISALTTKDPNKLKVYLDGYDGHSLRAYTYFGEQMPDITPTVQSINSIKEKYPKLRQKSKAPTFLLTYGGTYHGLMHNAGFSKEEALSIEEQYHKLYAVSDEWVRTQIEDAAECGYVTVAFGLRVRTPTIHRCQMFTSKTPYEAQAEARTAGNALGQSYGLLNNRSGIDLQERLFSSEYSYDVKPVAHIHDAQYFMVRDNIDIVHWLNTHLVETMSWQQLSEIQHPDVHLGGELSIFYPHWGNEITLPNNASADTLRSTFLNALDNKDNKAAA